MNYSPPPPWLTPPGSLYWAPLLPKQVILKSFPYFFFSSFLPHKKELPMFVETFPIVLHVIPPTSLLFSLSRLGWEEKRFSPRPPISSFPVFRNSPCSPTPCTPFLPPRFKPPHPFRSISEISSPPIEIFVQVYSLVFLTSLPSPTFFPPPFPNPPLSQPSFRPPSYSPARSKTFSWRGILILLFFLFFPVPRF